MDAIVRSPVNGRKLPDDAVGPACFRCKRQMRLSVLKPDSSHPYRLPWAVFDCECGRSISMRWRPESRRFAVMAGVHDELRRDFAVYSEPYGSRLAQWRWEIKRLSKPLGIKLYDDGFSSAQDAKLAGEKALLHFLEGFVLDQTSQIGV